MIDQDEFNGEVDEFYRGLQKLCPFIGLEEGSRTVTDVDEEIFLLYTLSKPPVNRQGLGQLDGKSDALKITVDLSDANILPTVTCTEDGDDDDDDEISVRNLPSRSMKARKKERLTSMKKSSNHNTLKVTVKQDLTSLRSTKGDTGSVVWRSSVYFASKILIDITASQEQIARPINSPLMPFIFTPASLKQIRILELGSGTGILPAMILRHPFFSSSLMYEEIQWIASDQAQIVPLLRRNIEKLSGREGIKATATIIDWIEASQIYCKGSASALQSYLSSSLQFQPKDDNDEMIQYPDIIFATDCIFNPHLFKAFLDTLTLFTLPRKTIVMVVCELRQADMMHDFLDAWLNHQGKWNIRTIESQDVLGPHLSHGSVVWLAWRSV